MTNLIQTSLRDSNSNQILSLSKPNTNLNHMINITNIF